jgi:hypothetical protein
MSVLQDKHGNPLRSVASARKDYLLSQNDFEALIQETHKARSKVEAQVNSTKVWKTLGDKYNFDYQSVGRPLNEKAGPRVFSAIPLDNEEEEDEQQ